MYKISNILYGIQYSRQLKNLQDIVENIWIFRKFENSFVEINNNKQLHFIYLFDNLYYLIIAEDAFLQETIPFI